MSILLSLAEPASTGTRIDWELLLSVTITAVTGLWTLYTWRNEKHREREARQDREAKELAAREREIEAREARERNEERRRAALYTMPFMLAAESLESRLYNLLELDGLGALRDAYPDGQHADETLYLVAQFLGWARCMTRYTRYAYEETFSDDILEIQDLLATQRHGAGLRIYRNDQVDLGRLALDRYQGGYGAEFDSVGEAAFTERLAKAGSLHSMTRRALAGLREAKDMAELDEPTRARMAKLQGALCDLLERLEAAHGVRVFRTGKRRRAEVPGGG